jgi:hypothetical protein
MQAVSTSQFNLSMLRKHNVWYTIKDGNWSDPAVWIGNGTKRYSVPQVGDDVYISNNITMDIATITVRNLYVTGSLTTLASPGVTLTINGDCQVSGNGLISLPLYFHNLVLNGYNNIIPYVGFNAGNYSTVTYNGFFDQFLLNIPYKHLSTQNGNKYQITDITVGGNLNQQSNYECGAYNLTVNGSSTMGTVGSYTFSKNSSTGSILFIGAVDFEGYTDLSVGNPNVEFRNGLTIHTYGFTSGSGVFTFSTNNQTITSSAFLGGVWNASIIVSGSITLTLLGGSQFRVNNNINGTVAGSTFNNAGVLFLGYNATPMTIGVFNYQYSSTSTLGYAFNGSYTLPYSTYANLVISGTGTKILGTNTVIGQAFTNNGGFDSNGYNLTVTGAFTNGDLAGHGDFTSNAFSTIVFIGFVELQSGGSTGFDLTTGNPNVEFRSGWDVHSSSPTKTGTGIYSFTTNNQTVSFSAYNSGVSTANFLISGAITITFTTGTTIPNFTGTLNGDNASSIFDCRGTFMYQNSTAPMATGKLYCNQASNTFIYGLAGNQDITVPSDATPGYKNLTFQGSGAKRLLGNVSVKGIYTLTSPATLNTNGYSLTNP